MLMLAMLYRRTYVQICLRCKKVNIIRGKFNKHIYFSMQENNDSAYTLNLNNVHLPETPKRNRKGQWNKGCVAWNRGKKWNEMFDAETIERLKKHLRELGKRAGNRGKGFEQLWRPVIQMDEYGNRLHWYQSSAHAARKLGLQARNIRAVCYGDRPRCGGFRWKFDEHFL